MIRYSDSDFFVKDSSLADVPLYAQLLRNDMWLQNSGFKKEEVSMDAQIIRFLKKEHPDDIKWVCFDRKKGYVGFVHFKVATGCAYVVGGVATQYLNSGVGLKYYVWCIDLYFRQGGKKKLLANIYQENIRSCRMHLGLGFEMVGLKHFDSLIYDVYEIDSERFYRSPIVMRYLTQSIIK